MDFANEELARAVCDSRYRFFFPQGKRAPARPRFMSEPRWQLPARRPAHPAVPLLEMVLILIFLLLSASSMRGSVTVVGVAVATTI